MAEGQNLRVTGIIGAHKKAPHKDAGLRGVVEGIHLRGGIATESIRRGDSVGDITDSGGREG